MKPRWLMKSGLPAHPDYNDVEQDRHDAWDHLYAAMLDQFGENDIARLFRSDREQFEEYYEAGRRFFHGSQSTVGDDAWLDDLLAEISGCVEPEREMGPLGLKYFEEEGFWEVWIYPTGVELVGGAHDGAVIAPGFSLDLKRLGLAFDAVLDFSWDALGLNSEGPHITIEGVFQGHEVLRPGSS